MRQAQYRSPRQSGAAAACPCHRPSHQRRRLAAPGMGGDAATRACRRGGADFHQRAPPQDLAWLRRKMSAFDKYPLGKPAFVTHVLDRAAHLRTNDEKLFALEGQQNARAYVIYRDSLLMKQEESGPRALLSIKEALNFGANPGTIFLGLRDGAPIFGMGIAPAAAETLISRNDVAISELRGMAMQGVLPLEQLSA